MVYGGQLMVFWWTVQFYGGSRLNELENRQKRLKKAERVQEPAKKRQ